MILTTSDDDNVCMFCGDNVEDEMYSRYMYNFIADIIDFIGELERTTESNKKEAEEVLRVEGDVVEE